MIQGTGIVRAVWLPLFATLGFFIIASATEIRAEDSRQAVKTKLVQIYRDPALTDVQRAGEVINLLRRFPKMDGSSLPPEALKPASIEILGDSLLLSIFDEFRNQGQQGSALPLIQFARSILPQNSLSLTKIERLTGLEERFEHEASAGTLKSMLKLKGELRTRMELELLEAHVTRLRLKEAETARAAGNYDEVLTQIAAVPANLRTKSANDAAREAVAKLSTASSSSSFVKEKFSLNTPEVMELISNLEQNDPGLTSTLVTLFSRQLLEMVSENKVDSASKTLSEILKRRPDPNPENNELRWTILQRAKGERARRFALGRLRELREGGELSITQRLQLLAYGYISWPHWSSIGILLVCVVLGVLLAYFPWRRFAARSTTGVGRWIEEKLKTEKKLPGYMIDVTGKDEYTTLLGLLGLEDGASDAEIKKAYRAMIKELHPDAQATIDSEKEARFQELKAAYERLMEMKGGWFGRQ